MRSTHNQMQTRPRPAESAYGSCNRQKNNHHSRSENLSDQDMHSMLNREWNVCDMLCKQRVECKLNFKVNEVIRSGPRRLKRNPDWPKCVVERTEMSGWTNPATVHRTVIHRCSSKAVVQCPQEIEVHLPKPTYSSQSLVIHKAYGPSPRVILWIELVHIVVLWSGS